MGWITVAGHAAGKLVGSNGGRPPTLNPFVFLFLRELNLFLFLVEPPITDGNEDPIPTNPTGIRTKWEGYGGYLAPRVCLAVKI